MSWNMLDCTSLSIKFVNPQMRYIRPFYSYDSQDAESFAAGLNKGKKTAPERYSELVPIIQDLNDLATGGMIACNEFRDQREKSRIEKHFGKNYSVMIDDRIFVSDPSDVAEFAIRRLNRRLEKYAYRAEVIQWHKNELNIEWKHASPGASRIYMVLRLAESGLLVRVRQCERCGDWFYAKRDRTRFCKKVCAQLQWQSSETGKAKRKEYLREYMREYRKEQAK
jgi:hypothetical protein